MKPAFGRKRKRVHRDGKPTPQKQAAPPRAAPSTPAPTAEFKSFNSGPSPADTEHRPHTSKGSGKGVHLTKQDNELVQSLCFPDMEVSCSQVRDEHQAMADSIKSFTRN